MQSREKDLRRLARRLHLVSDDDEPRCRCTFLATLLQCSLVFLYRSLYKASLLQELGQLVCMIHGVGHRTLCAMQVPAQSVHIHLQHQLEQPQA